MIKGFLSRTPNPSAIRSITQSTTAASTLEATRGSRLLVISLATLTAISWATFRIAGTPI